MPAHTDRPASYALSAALFPAAVPATVRATPAGYYGPPPTQKRSGFLGGLGVGCLIAVGLAIVAGITIVAIIIIAINGASRAVVNTLTFPDVHLRLRERCLGNRPDEWLQATP